MSKLTPWLGPNPRPTIHCRWIASGNSPWADMSADLVTHLNLLKTTAALREELDAQQVTERELRDQLQHQLQEKREHVVSQVDALLACAAFLSGSQLVSQRQPAGAHESSPSESWEEPVSPWAAGEEESTSPREAETLFATGKRLNEAGNFWGAYTLFMHAYTLQPRAAVLLSLANMSLKIGEPHLAGEIYRRFCDPPRVDASKREVEAARRKLADAEALIADPGRVPRRIHSSSSSRDDASDCELGGLAEVSAAALVAEASHASAAALQRADQRTLEAERRAAEAEEASQTSHTALQR